MTSRPFALIVLLGILCTTAPLAAEIYFREVALLTPPGGTATSFGRSVDISGNLVSDEVIRGSELGDELGFAVGAPGRESGGIDRGLVRVGSEWDAPSDSHDYQYFGCDVALSNDLLAVTSEESTLYLFEYSGVSSWDEASVIANAGR